jgi:hypothetical protein
VSVVLPLLFVEKLAEGFAEKVVDLPVAEEEVIGVE